MTTLKTKLPKPTSYRLGRWGSMLGLVISAAFIGAWWQASWGNATAISPSSVHLMPDNRGADSSVTQDFTQRLGELQAKLIEVEQLAKRIAESTGVSYTHPELKTPSGDTETLALLPPLPLSQQADQLYTSLSAQLDWFNDVHAVLNQRTANQARFPTGYPLAETMPISSDFGWRKHPIKGRQILHQGIDFSAPVGTPIVAASGGMVTKAAYMPGYGKTVEITHGDGLISRYAHASTLLVQAGDFVQAGQRIARVGATGQTTGAHLHFEVRLDDQPLDPKLFLSPSTQTQVAQLTEP